MKNPYCRLTQEQILRLDAPADHKGLLLSFFDTAENGYVQVPPDTFRELIEIVVERAELAAWKESALSLEREWDQQRIAKLLGGKLGRSCRKVINERVPVLTKRLERAVEIIAAEWFCDEKSVIERLDDDSQPWARRDSQ